MRNAAILVSFLPALIFLALCNYCYSICFRVKIALLPKINTTDMHIRQLEYIKQRMKKIFLYLLFSTALIGVRGQSVFLAREDAVKLATDSSRQMQIADNLIETAEAKYRQTDAVFLPRVGIDYAAMITNNPLNAFGFKLQQRSIAQSDFAPDLLNSPNATGDFSAKATLMQPVFNAELLVLRHAARKQIAIAGFKKQRTRDYVRFTAETEYSQLQMSCEMLHVSKEALNTLQAIYKWVKDRYDQGYVQKSDLLNVEVQVKAVETQIANAESMIAEHSDNLSLLMGKTIGTRYSPDSLQIEDFGQEAGYIPDTRSDYKAMETAIASYNDLMKSTRYNLVPKVIGFASYQINDKSMFGFGNSAYLAGVQLTWNIFQGNEVHNKLVTQRLEQKQIKFQLADQKEQDAKALAKANQQLKNAAFQLDQYKAAVAQAEEALQILQNRYKQGLAGTTDVLQAQTQLSQQHLYYKQAVTMHNSTLAYIRFLTAQ